jgi:alkylhydroperoxidase family enzyme
MELQALAAGEWGNLFTPRERAALDYASVVAVTNPVAEEIFAPVRAHFSEEEIIELTATITFEICVAKFNRALEIEWNTACPL